MSALDDATRRALIEGRHGDAFGVLGLHDGVVRTLQPGAEAVDVVDERGIATPLVRLDREGLFEGDVAGATPRYRLRIRWPDATQETRDAYSFEPQLGDLDLHLIGEGRHHALADALGANPATVDGVAGTRFAVWAPNASHASVVGDFNVWDRRRHPMRLRYGAGVWELFIPGVAPGARYKFALRDAHGNALPDKADPVARQAELAPATASIVAARDAFAWSDAEWMKTRANRHAIDAPIRIYEMHAASWMQDDGKPLAWSALADRLLPYVTGMGFSHIELLPISEHPFSGSWGYQPLGLFAPTARHGPPEEFARFVDRCHRDGIGVIVDWVPAHFPADAHGLARFDGTALYEHADPREGFHQDWNTLIYNHGRNEVRGFLIASALEWLKRFHVDGLRVDAVASMLYRDYSRRAGEWIPNVHGGRENYESIDFLRELNTIVHAEAPGVMMIAEESTAWPGVTSPPERGGLGFDYKWNMGWMHDTLEYMARDPVHRRWHHSEMTFGLLYAYSEHFVLPLSHDEVVHGKHSLLGRMPGDAWRRFANLRAYFAFMWTHPGKKLLFMGGELAQDTEWNHDVSLPWHLLDDPAHRGVQRLVRDLNFLYERRPALHAKDSEPDGFAWVVGDDAADSVYAYLRRGGDDEVLVVANMTPTPHHDYRVGVPARGVWRELLNSDAAEYEGSGVGNDGKRATDDIGVHGFAQSLSLTLPPLGVVVLALREID
ncbi:MAG: 1,4-alpha-glucan branching protein GlgB [Rhodanobacteraceae bacterium]